MPSLKNHLLELLVASALILLMLLSGYIIIFPGSSHENKRPISETPNLYQEEASPDSQEPALRIGLPTTAEIVEILTQDSTHAHLLGDSEDSGSPPPWLADFESMAGTGPLDPSRVIQLWAYVDSLEDREKRLVAYALIADQAEPRVFQAMIWPKVWNSSTDLEVCRIIANTVPKMPEETMFPYLLALLQHPDEETRAIARGILWGYFPDIPESDYARAIQYRNLR